MAYADFDFYSNTYYGEVLTAENANRWLDRAGDELDALTFGRLIFAFPTIEAHAVKVKKAVCAIAEALLCIDIQSRAASAQKAQDGTYHGAIASMTAGKETISYATGASSSSVYALAAASAEAQASLLSCIAAKYLANIPDANGVNLLYAGGAKRVRQNCDAF